MASLLTNYLAAQQKKVLLGGGRRRYGRRHTRLAEARVKQPRHACQHLRVPEVGTAKLHTDLKFAVVTRGSVLQMLANIGQELWSVVRHVGFGPYQS